MVVTMRLSFYVMGCKEINRTERKGLVRNMKYIDIWIFKRPINSLPL